MGRLHEAETFMPQKLPGLSGPSRSTGARGSWSFELWARQAAQRMGQSGVSRDSMLSHLKPIFPARSPVP